MWYAMILQINITSEVCILYYQKRVLYMEFQVQNFLRPKVNRFVS